MVVFSDAPGGSQEFAMTAAELAEALKLHKDWRISCVSKGMERGNDLGK
jgi:hypothetical protein